MKTYYDTYSVEFYGDHRTIKSRKVEAKNDTDAVNKIRESGEYICEVISVRNLDFPKQGRY